MENDWNKNQYFDYQVIEDKDVIAVRLQFVLTDPVFEVVEATASAKRDPIDKFDREVGYNLAIGRAFEKLGQKLIKRGNGKSRHNDELREKKDVIQTRMVDVTKPTAKTEAAKRLIRKKKA